MVYEPQTIAKIIEAAGRLPPGGNPDALAADLEEAAGRFLVWRSTFDNVPSKAKRLKAFQEIEKLSERLAKVLGALEGADIRDTEPHLFTALTRQADLYAQRDGPYHELEPTPVDSDTGERVMDYGSAVAVLRAAEGVWRLHQWAEAGREETEAPDYEHWVPEGPSAEAWLIGKKLPEIYERHFGGSFGVSKPGERTGLDEQERARSEVFGPSIRFVQACLEPLGIQKKPDAIEKHWDRYRQTWDTPAKK